MVLGLRRRVRLIGKKWETRVKITGARLAIFICSRVLREFDLAYIRRQKSLSIEKKACIRRPRDKVIWKCHHGASKKRSRTRSTSCVTAEVDQQQRTEKESPLATGGRVGVTATSWDGWLQDADYGCLHRHVMRADRARQGAPALKL
jgi:hypothetical protein